MEWTKDKITSLLPHRDPFLFVDEVTEATAFNRVVAKRLIRSEEYYFKGHFPGKPVMPGVLIVETMAQVSIILYAICKPELAQTKPDYYLGKVKAEFLSPAVPGDTLIIEANYVKIIDDAGIVDAVARVNERIVAKANLVFAIKPKNPS